jgi:hypothetical protein
MNCRHCKKPLKLNLVDLGFAPPSNAYLYKDDLKKPEKYYPLNIKVCENCWLVQTEDYADADELFSSDYAYFSSTSLSFLEHAKEYVQSIVRKLSLNKNSMVTELASNDGYLLRNFLNMQIPCLGIEPTKSTAIESEKLGIETIQEFFGEKLATKLSSDGYSSDLIIGNNVYAHVPDINDFTKGIKILLKKDGVVTLEFPHLLKLMQGIQFDTIYHEHFSYLSLFTVSRIFEEHELKVFDVDEISTHGGSLRIYGCNNSDPREITNNFKNVLNAEKKYGLQELETYKNFQNKVEIIKNELISFLIEKKKSGKKVAAYGAAAKGNTLLNYAGIKSDLISFVCDAAYAKQNKYLPGSHIPIYPPDKLKSVAPDYVVILPWNIAEEITEQNRSLIENGTKFVSFVPKLTYHD